MPNHVKNELTVTGDSQNVKNLFENIKGEDCLIDFRKIIPLPEEIFVGNVPSDAKSMAKLVLGGIDLHNVGEHDIVNMLEVHNILRDLKDGGVNQMNDESFEAFIQMVKGGRKHGYIHAMDFATKEWNTKWNAYECEKVEDGKIKFETAWAAPIPVIQELSRQYPLCYISLKYADEDSGSNTGAFEFERGEVQHQYKPENGSNEGFQFFFDLWPDRAEDYEFVNGKWQIKDEEEI